MIECLESRAREERDENAPALVENPSEDGERPRQPIRLQMNKRVPGENPGPPVFQAGKIGKRPEPERNRRVGPARNVDNLRNRFEALDATPQTGEVPTPAASTRTAVTNPARQRVNARDHHATVRIAA